MKTPRKLSAWMVLAFFLCCIAAQAAPAKVLRDMAGEAVSIPTPVTRVATLGATPVLNSLVFAVGAGEYIINGLPEFARQPRWAYQKIFAPQIAAAASLQNHDRTPNLEALINAAPDAVLTMDRASADSLRRAGIPALYIAWRKPEEIKLAVSLLGELFDRPLAVKRYSQYFDTTLQRVATVLERASTRPRVLYFSPSTLTQPHLVAEWWIRAAGGISVTDDGRRLESRSFTLEQLLSWNPDILIVASQEEADKLRRETRFAALQAVRNGRILVTPCGAHTWGNRTAEQPLTVLWAAKQFHPALFNQLDLVNETQSFYRSFFGSELAADQVREILGGGPRSTVSLK